MGRCRVWKGTHNPHPRLMTRFFLAILALLLTVPVASAQLTVSGTSQAEALPPLRNVDDMSHGRTQRMAVSGTNQSGGHDLMVPDGGYVVGVRLAERSDKPCFVELAWSTVDNGTHSVSYSTFNRCDGSPTNRSREYAGWNGLGDNPIAMKGLEVCQRNSNDRMKGLRVRGVRLSNTGGATIRTRPHRRDNGQWYQPKIERTNCNDWDDMVMCPNQQVVVGVRIEGRDMGYGDRAQIQGLAPICAPLRFEG
ncbi:MAG: hypothetical protein Rubg2KO_34640 [Rubricoccaceae bacterium]